MDYYGRHRVDTMGHRTHRYSSVYTMETQTGPTTEYTFQGSKETWDNVTIWPKYSELVSKGQIRPGDVGGPFESREYRYEDDSNSYHPVHATKTHPEYYGYSGPQFAKFANADLNTVGAWTLASPSSEEELDIKGTTAISRCAPLNPHAAATTAVAETMRDGIPAFLGVNSVFRHDHPSEYLNYEFGVKPFLNDISQLTNAYVNAHKVLAQYYRDSGKIVRRSYRFPSDMKVTTEVTDGVKPVPNLNSYLYEVTSGTLTKTTTTLTDCWFSGAFTYHARPTSGSFAAISEQVNKARYLYGLSIDPGTIWDLMPYSWAIDWVTNMGDALNNASMFLEDGLVMRYGYVMEHKLIITEYSHVGTVLKPGLPVRARQVFTTDIKRRRAATPFGFGLTPDSFTTRQWAILAALGMSRSRVLAR